MKSLPCIGCGCRQLVDPAVERVWCQECAVQLPDYDNIPMETDE